MNETKLLYGVQEIEKIQKSIVGIARLLKGASVQ